MLVHLMSTPLTWASSLEPRGEGMPLAHSDDGYLPSRRRCRYPNSAGHKQFRQFRHKVGSMSEPGGSTYVYVSGVLSSAMLELIVGRHGPLERIRRVANRPRCGSRLGRIGRQKPHDERGFAARLRAASPIQAVTGGIEFYHAYQCFAHRAMANDTQRVGWALPINMSARLTSVGRAHPTATALH
jgi:hypothetical protein